MGVEEEKFVEMVIKPGALIKHIELKNIGFLQKEATYVNCPACEVDAVSLVRLDAVTCVQRFLEMTNWCKSWPGRYDINHYCSKCGCYIGRYVPVDCMERCISRSARNKAARGDMSLKAKPKDCAERVQKMRDSWKAEQAQKKAARDAEEGRQTEVAKRVTVASGK